MKNHIVLLFFLGVLFIGCKSAKYSIVNNSPFFSLDLKTGKWLLNDIESTNSVKFEISKIANDKFTQLLGSNFSSKANLKGVLLPNKISLKPNENLLKEIKKNSGFDYLINIKAELIRNDIDGVRVVTESKYNTPQKRIAEVTLEIYNLNNFEIIYSKKAIGIIEIPNNKNDFYFVNSSNKLLIKCTERLLNNLEKNSLK